MDMNVSAVLQHNVVYRVTSGQVSTPDPSDSDDLVAYIYFYCTLVMSILSILGTSIIITTFWYFDDIRSTGRRILLYISIADLLTAVGNIMGIVWYETKPHMSEDMAEGLCTTHALITTFSCNCSYFWTVAMATHLYMGIVLRKRLWSEKLAIFHIFCWGFSAAISLVVLSADVIGYDETLTTPSWCWIDPDAEPSQVMWQYLGTKLWEMLAFIVILGLYSAIKCTLWKQVRRNVRRVGTASSQADSNATAKRRNKAVQDASRKLTFVPVVFLLCRMWGTIRFIMGAHFPDKLNGGNSTWLVVFQGVGDSAQGFANCILYIIAAERLRTRMIVCLCADCCLGKCCSDPQPHGKAELVPPRSAACSNPSDAPISNTAPRVRVGSDHAGQCMQSIQLNDLSQSVL